MKSRQDAPTSRSFLRSLTAAAVLGVFGVAPAQKLPQYAEPTHLGVGTCSSSQCHGAVLSAGEEDRSPLLNEYRTWARHDRHSEAYEILGNSRSKAIAANLGLGDARSADLCLDCHADNVPEERRGEGFQISDGVACEACHGGAEKWIESHASGTATHQENVARGMYPTDDPRSRAELCMSCHLGSERKPLTHRLMAAGHPRTSFELDTFTQIQPAHFVANQGYAERKASPSAAKVWAVGQGVGLDHYMSILSDPEHARDGAWPEFALYDCFSCHHDMGTQPLTAAVSHGLRIGYPRFDEVRFLLYREILAMLDSPEAAGQLDGDLRKLNRAASVAYGDVTSIAADIRSQVRDTIGRLEDWDPEAADLRTLLERLVDPERARAYRTYAVAEQVTMAVQALLTTMQARGHGEASMDALRSGLDALFAATEAEERFRPASFREAVARVRAAL